LLREPADGRFMRNAWLSSRAGNGRLGEVLESGGNFSGDFLEMAKNGSIPPIRASF